jgi:hypothetical protein
LRVKHDLNNVMMELEKYIIVEFGWNNRVYTKNHPALRAPLRRRGKANKLIVAKNKKSYTAQFLKKELH